MTSPDPFHVPDELRDYFQAIETFVSRQRGQPLILSPQDFARVFEWWDAQVPIAAVIEGLANFYEKKKKRRPGAKIYTLAYADDEVAKALKDLRRQALGASLGMVEDDSAQIVAQLEKLAAKLRECGAAQPESLQRWCASAAAQLKDMAARIPPPATVEAAKWLAQKDRELLAVALAQMDAGESEALETAVAAQLAELAIGPEDQAMRDLLRARRLRELKHLPRLGLYG